MPRIFDNIEKTLLPALQQTLEVAERADFCVGYFNLRGWRHLADYADRWIGGDGYGCRLLIGMHIAPSDALRQALRPHDDDAEDWLDHQTAIREKRRIAQEFRDQLTFGAPSNADEYALQQLARQIREQKLIIKVYLRHTLHAKLYLLYRKDPINPIVGYLGSSNLTLAGLARQGELNVDVLDGDATDKLAAWFEDRWHDRWCLDISKELAEIIDTSWAGERLIPPYHVYLKMAYHLAQEARAGLAQFRIPAIFADRLFAFQVAAVKIAAHHLHKRGGVLIGDVVGLGKSIMATALAKVFEDDFHTETLILCPKNLVPMWEDYAHTYRLHAKVLSISKVIHDLPEKTRRHRVVLIDESHNLRNKEGKRWRVIRDYIERNDSLCILLSATPYNKTYQDLSAQLSLFIREDHDLGIRPEKLIAALGGEHEFMRRHQCPVRSIAAFEKSEDPNDWRDLMRLYMVRRTRSFIMRHYAQNDERGNYLPLANGQKSYFPQRIPKTLTFTIDDTNPADPYARFYSTAVVTAINALILPRYGLGHYLVAQPQSAPTAEQLRIIEGLSRAGTRLMGFCRTNLFKRLESAGPAFILSVQRHILRNFIVLHALETHSPIPLGTQGAELLDTRYHDVDADISDSENDSAEGEDTEIAAHAATDLHTEEAYRARAATVYAAYSDQFRRRFKWLPSRLFVKALAQDLLADARKLLDVLACCGLWQPAQDTKLKALIQLIAVKHPQEKIIVFTQFADTAHYLKAQLDAHGIQQVAVATGNSADPTQLAWRFAPEANGKRDLITAAEEVRVLVATDVLSEGQNLQDGAIIVNYDLPWAIIRLIQRAGRVDRIGQKSERILCYSFMPAEGVERLIRLRARVRQRLEENAEVVGSDERFFDGDSDDQAILNLYNETCGILDDDGDTEVDLASYAYQIWKNATDADPRLSAKIEALPNVVYATQACETVPKGALVYMRTGQGHDALAWIDAAGHPVTQSQLAILKAAACSADTVPLPRTEQHHGLTECGLKHIMAEEQSFGGALGRPTGARFKTYERLKRYRASLGDHRDLLTTDEQVRRIERAMEDLYRYPLYQSAIDTLNRQLKSGIEDHTLAELVLNLREDGHLCLIAADAEPPDPQLICSMGLV